VAGSRRVGRGCQRLGDKSNEEEIRRRGDELDRKEIRKPEGRTGRRGEVGVGDGKKREGEKDIDKRRREGY